MPINRSTLLDVVLMTAHNPGVSPYDQVAWLILGGGLVVLDIPPLFHYVVIKCYAIIQYEALPLGHCTSKNLTSSGLTK